MVIPIYRCWVDVLSFERTGQCVARVEVPEGSSLESVTGLFGHERDCSMTVLMVPTMDDPSVRYAWNAVDVMYDVWDPLSRFRLLSLAGIDRSGITFKVGVN